MGMVLYQQQDRLLMPNILVPTVWLPHVHSEKALTLNSVAGFDGLGDKL